LSLVFQPGITVWSNIGLSIPLEILGGGRVNTQPEIGTVGGYTININGIVQNDLTPCA
jgi:hypothetical protein